MNTQHNTATTVFFGGIIRALTLHMEKQLEQQSNFAEASRGLGLIPKTFTSMDDFFIKYDRKKKALQMKLAALSDQRN